MLARQQPVPDQLMQATLGKRGPGNQQPGMSPSNSQRAMLSDFRTEDAWCYVKSISCFLKFADVLEYVAFVKTSYFKTVMLKPESPRSHESRAQSGDSSESLQQTQSF